MPVVAIVAVSALAVVIVVAVPVAVAAVVTVERNSKGGTELPMVVGGNAAGKSCCCP